MNRQGFTLLEMLVAMAILSIVMAALLSLTTGTLSFSAVAMSSADRQRELNDATGYIADSVRRASQVSTTTTLNGSACSPSPAASSCFSVVVPEAVGGSTINKYTQFFYRLEPRAQLAANLKVPETWADANTYVVKEYRQVLCGPAPATACTATPPTAAATATISTGALVVDELALNNGTGTYQPFSYDSASGQFTLQFRIGEKRQNQVRYTPTASEAPYRLVVNKRN